MMTLAGRRFGGQVDGPNAMRCDTMRNDAMRLGEESKFEMGSTACEDDEESTYIKSRK